MSEAKQIVGEVEIPGGDGVIYAVACPLLRFAVHDCRRCEKCAHFGGLLDTLAAPIAAQASAPDFEVRYRVLCKHPTARQIQQVRL